MRLLSYPDQTSAIADAVRLAEGMTRKHNCYNTGFSGAKLVVHCGGGVTPKSVDRLALMEDCADALEALRGAVWTGCDLNTTGSDMDMLVSLTPYVLAGLGSSVDTNVATAMTTIGSILGVAEAEGLDLSEQTFMVQGCGKVGSHVARSLAALGAKDVHTCDAVPSRAIIPGCTPLPPGSRWHSVPVDFLVPCGNSLAIDRVALSGMSSPMSGGGRPPRYVVGAANQPYASGEVRDEMDKMGALHVPESISSGGAIMADAIEWAHPELYREVEPELVYGWIRDLSRAKSSELVVRAEGEALNVRRVVEGVYEGEDTVPVGMRFPEWMRENGHEVETAEAKDGD
ncbi:hypothetical protein TrRE_jg8677 [Triparma retinervis]|uniref:Glutamate/phenylalanine/leucine/valine/L-tryptophan dehydrogenase C-terminal domain-containing protein n=1 Tax=Triparma retinervis TaxID=2557542 RepID=A0A9W7G2E7_9STRA|nr:hypothetical protein TrRE_jg8677 [Triparma retinervis]